MGSEFDHKSSNGWTAQIDFYFISVIVNNRCTRILCYTGEYLKKKICSCSKLTCSLDRHFPYL